jgi:hypothetical protein
MAIEVHERITSREGTSTSNNLDFWIRGTTVYADVITAMLSTAPAVFNNLLVNDWNAKPVGENFWYGTVLYGLRERPEAGSSSFNFDMGAGSYHITHSLQTIQAKAPAGQTAPDFKGAINVHEDRVEGVDIMMPEFRFAETHYLPVGVVTAGYINTVFGLVAQTNSTAYKGFAIGEVIFEGAAGAQRGGEDWEITYRFAVSPNRTGITIGDITGINKKGWQYLWVLYEKTKDATAKKYVRRAVAAYVEQVYYEGDLGNLQIGA